MKIIIPVSSDITINKEKRFNRFFIVSYQYQFAAILQTEILLRNLMGGEKHYIHVHLYYNFKYNIKVRFWIHWNWTL